MSLFKKSVFSPEKDRDVRESIVALCDAQMLYDKFKDDVLRYDIAMVMIHGKLIYDTTRQTVIAGLERKYNYRAKSEKLTVYDKIIFIDYCKDIDSLYRRKYYRCISHRIQRMTKTNPKYNAEDIFNALKGYKIVSH